MVREDLDEILRIERENFMTPWTVSQFADDLDSGNHDLISCDHEGKPIAYMVLWRVLDELHLTNISVDQRHRRQGIAQKMLDYAIRVAGDRHCHQINLEVREGNEAALALYRKNHFQQVGRRPNYYSAEHADALLMSRNIGGKHELV